MPESWEVLHRIADAKELSLRRTFLAAFRDTQDNVVLAQLKKVLIARDMPAALQIATTAFESGKPAFRSQIQKTYLEIMGQFGKPEIASALLPPGVEAYFDVTNPKVFEWINTELDDFFGSMDKNSRAALQEVVTWGFSQGRHPTAMARELKSVLSLPPNHVKAVQGYRKFLEELGQRDDLTSLPKSVMQRLRRSDIRLFAPKSGLNQGRIDKLTGAYKRRLLREYAETLTRTATIKASAEGQNQLWNQALDEGLLNRNKFEVRWITTPDDRACQICMARNNKRRPIDGSYPGGYGGPTAHLQCRCAEGLVRKRKRIVSNRI